MPYEIVVDEKTGQRRAVVTGSVYKPKEGEEPTGAGPTLPSPMDLYQATRGFTPQGMLESGVKAAGQAVGRGFKELQQTGNLGKATEAAGKELSQQLQAPGMLSQRVGYNAARDLAQSVLGNLPAAGSRKPGQADSPILGVLPPLPRIKSTGVAEDVATGFVQGALAWIPAARGVSLAAKGLSMVPGVGAAAQATRTAAAFAQGGGVAPRLAVGAAKAVVKGAPTGALVDALAFTPGEQTMTGQIIDWVEKQAGTPLHGPLVDLLQTKPGDTEAEARWKEAVGGAMVIGPAAEAVIRTTGLAARSLFNLAKVKQAAKAVPTPEAPAAAMPSAEAAPVAAPAAAAVEAPTVAPRPSQLEVEEAATQAARAVEDMDAAMSGAVDYGQQVARQVTTPPAAAAAEVPAVGTPAAAPQADPFAGASRKITETTNENRIQNAAESLASWTAKVGGEPMSVDEALRLVKAKGAILDPDRVPGLDMETARNDKTKGVSDTPATEAVAAAYRQFYGLEAPPTAVTAPAQQTETKALLDKALANVPPEKRAAIQKQMEERGLAQAGDGEQVDFKPLPPEAIDAIGQELTGIIRQIAGEDVGIRFNNAFVIAPKPRAWGGKSANQLSYRKGSYDYFQDIITVNGMGFDTPIGGKVQTAFHEAWHRVQFNFLTSKELRALNSMYAQLRFQAPGPAEEVTLIERQAIAFQRYAYAKRNNLPIAPFVAGASEQELRGLRDGQPIPGLEKAAIKAATVGVQIIDGLVDFAEKVGNVLQNRGWTSTRTIFEQAYSGKLAQTRGDMGNALLMAEEAATLKGRMAAGEQVSTAELQTGIENIRRAKILNELERTNQIQFTDANRGKLFSAGEDIPTGPRPPEPTPGPEDPDWVTSFARLLQDNRDKLLSGEATLEDLYKLNSFQKTQSPSGQQVYTAQSEDLIPGLNAMSQVLPDRATQSGIPSFTAAETVKLNQQWFDRHGEDGAAILRGLDTITQGFNAYEHGALNRAMALADLKQAEAQLEAARWLNSVGEPGANASERLAKLMTAADSARRMHLAIMKVTRPWGQLGAEMQLPRNYDIPTATGVVEEAVAPPAPGVSVVDQGIKQELEQADTVYDGLTSKVSPELTEAAQGGEITPKAEADADAIAQTIVSMGTEPKIRAKVWRKLDEVNQMDANALLMLRTNNLISSGITMMTNLTNGIANLGRLTLSQTSGAVLTGDFDRAMYSIQMLGSYLSNLQNGFRVAGHAFKAGQPLFNMEASSLDYLERLAKRDAQGELLQNDPTAMTGWTLNTMNMSQAWAETRPGQALNMLWKTVGTGASRVAITIDAFNSTIAGYSYEHFRHMPRGMELAVERGMKKYSPEAWDYAQQYAAARTDQAIKDAVINGKTLADVAMESPHAQKFMDAVNFTDKIWAELEPRTLDEGMRIGQTRGLKGNELTAFAKKYVDEGFFIHKLADGMLNGPLPFGRIGSLPGEAIQTLSNARLIGPVFKFIQPFQRVPSNILKSAMRSTPAAVFVDTFWRDITSADAGTRQRAIGEIAVGTGVLTMLTLATTMGYLRINGAGPQDPTAREKWMRDRQMPYSIQHWDQDNARWSAPVSLAAMEPFATLFGAVGDYNDVAASLPTESRNRLGSALALSLVRMQTSGLLSKTYFQGINELYEAAFDPAKTFAGPAQRDPFARYLQRIIASMVPYSSALRAARRQVDPIARSVEPSEAGGAWGFWQETWDEIRNAVPGYSQGLPARRDWTLPGAPPMVLPGVIGTGMIDEDAPFLAAMMQFVPWSAFRVGRPIEDPVQREMAELHGKGSTFSGPRASDFGPEMRLTPSQLAQYQEAFGSVKDEFGRTWHQAVTELINSAEYQAMPIEPPSTQQVSFRAAFIQQEIQKYKELAKQLFMGTTIKGAEIERNKLMLQGRQDEMNFYRRYGVSGASRSNDAQTFVQEMNR